MNQVHVGRRTYQVPGRFVELSPRQLVAVVGLLHTPGLPVLALKLLLMLALLDVRRRPWLYWQLHRLSDEQRHELLPLADFCLQAPRFTQQLLPTLRVPGRRWLPGSRGRWFGPAAGFANLTFAEFIQAEGFFAAYQGPGDEQALDSLVATLYRPFTDVQGPGGDPRRPFEPGEVATRVPLAGRLPLAARLAVRMWYANCRGAWARKYRDTLFEPASDKPAAGQQPDPRETWRTILAERAGSPLHYDAFGQLPLPNVFFDLDQRIRRHRDAVAAAEEARKS